MASKLSFHAMQKAPVVRFVCTNPSCFEKELLNTRDAFSLMKKHDVLMPIKEKDFTSTEFGTLKATKKNARN